MELLPQLNNRFGPQLTGKETIADLFDGTSSLNLSVRDQREQEIRQNLPPKLLQELTAFKTKVTLKTLLHKFYLLIRWLEQRAQTRPLKAR